MGCWPRVTQPRPPHVCRCAVPTLSLPPQLADAKLGSGLLGPLSLGLRGSASSGRLRGAELRRRWRGYPAAPPRFLGPDHVTGKSDSSLHFPSWLRGNFVTEGAGAATLRRRLKITGIFKAVEESRDKQRLDSLPPGRSSFLPLAPS